MKIVTIKNCDDCPFGETGQCTYNNDYMSAHDLESSKFINLEEVPNWCPLDKDGGLVVQISTIKEG